MAGDVPLDLIHTDKIPPSPNSHNQLNTTNDKEFNCQVESRTVVSRSLYSMRSRCYNPDNVGYKYYGGRGIKVCDRWLYGEGDKKALDCFIEDVGYRPSKEYSLDRIDTNGNYEPDNCRWATPKEQSRNRRYNTREEFNGQLLTLAEIYETFKDPEVSYGTFCTRVRAAGLDYKEAAFTPSADTKKSVKKYPDMPDWEEF